MNRLVVNNRDAMPSSLVRVDDDVDVAEALAELLRDAGTK
jgi:hypothetical protein